MLAKELIELLKECDQTSTVWLSAGSVTTNAKNVKIEKMAIDLLSNLSKITIVG